MKKIFVSYRREDSQYVTGRITDHLGEKFGNDFFFKDVDSIPFGEDFRAAIAAAISESSLLLAIIGPNWMAVDATGKRRIDAPNDYVRSELQAAIERKIPIIPVLVDHAKMPTAESLPKDLREIIFLNALPIRPDPDFKPDVERLASQLEKQFGRLRRRTVMVTLAATGSGLLLAGFAVSSIWKSRFPEPVPQVSTKLRVGLKQWVGYTPLAVAHGLKLFPEQIDVEYRNVSSVEEMNTRLVNGEIDISLSLVESHVRAAETYQHDTANENRPVVILKLDTSRGADGIIALNEITDITQLGLSPNGEERPFLYQHHDVSHFLFLYLCKSAGLQWRDLKNYADDRNPEAAAELFARPVDTKYFAAGTYEPHLTMLRETVEGAHIIIDSDSEGVSGLVVDVMVTKKKFLDENRNAILALLKGWFAAIAILNDRTNSKYADAMRFACLFNGTPQDGKPWSVETWMQNKPCEETEYDKYVVGLTGKTGQSSPWPDRKENIDFFRRSDHARSRFDVVFGKCMELRQGRNLSDLEAVKFDGSMDVFFKE